MTENLNQLLLSAAESGTPEDVVAAIGKGADVDTRDPAGRTPLMLAAGTAGRVAVVRAILDAHASIDAQDNNGHTAVMEAILGRDLETLQVLLDRGPDLSIHGRTWLRSHWMNDSCVCPWLGGTCLSSVSKLFGFSRIAAVTVR